jgi:sugar phosphate isomerase/epimerase
MMVEFGTGYDMPMNREYSDHSHHGHVHDHGPSSQAKKNTNDIGVGLKDIGMSSAFGPVPNATAMVAKVRGGSKTLEIGFFGYGKGSGQGQTPGMYGKKQRQALEEMGKANKINFTTHSSVGVYGLAGMDQQGNFSKSAKENSVQEIRRAVEFASDVGRGGPVVVHTGEFQRAVVDADWNQIEGDKYKGKFQMFDDEEGRTSFRVVDSRSGGLIAEAKKNKKVSRPVWLRADSDNKDTGVKKGDYIDYFGNKLNSAERVPEYDSETQTFKIEQLEWNDLENEAKEMTERAKEDFKKWKSGKMSKEEISRSIWKRFLREDITEKSVNVKPEEAYIISTLETNAANSRGWALNYGGNFDEQIKTVKKLEKAKKLYQQIEETTDEEEKWKLKIDVGSELKGLIPSETKYPTELIDKQLKSIRHSMRQSQEAASAQMAQAEESMETIRHVESAESYALKEAYDAYAKSAISAMEHTKALDKEGKLKKPLTIAMENLFPETYGAHPNELIKLVKGSRDRMEKLLVQRGMSENEAQKKSKTHITATFDTGHLNMWRKYWKGDPGKTIKENDAAFDKWTIDKVEEMVKAGIIGHVHLDDNYGYQDEHLAPGEGNTPIFEMVKKLKELNYDGEFIVEPGADFTTDASGFHSVMKTWRLFGSPVYGAGSGFSGSHGNWNQVGYGWFGQNQPPYFSFGAYVPSEDWTLWSGVQLE